MIYYEELLNPMDLIKGEKVYYSDVIINLIDRIKEEDHLRMCRFSHYENNRIVLESDTLKWNFWYRVNQN